MDDWTEGGLLVAPVPQLAAPRAWPAAVVSSERI